MKHISILVFAVLLQACIDEEQSTKNQTFGAWVAIAIPEPYSRLEPNGDIRPYLIQRLGSTPFTVRYDCFTGALYVNSTIKLEYPKGDSQLCFMSTCIRPGKLKTDIRTEAATFSFSDTSFSLDYFGPDQIALFKAANQATLKVESLPSEIFGRKLLSYEPTFDLDGFSDGHDWCQKELSIYKRERRKVN